jgi:uncharacterized delta-60 repeat protein
MDTGFGNGGEVTVNLGLNEVGLPPSDPLNTLSIPSAITLQPDGTILVAGEALDSFNGDPIGFVARFQSGGTLDTSFGVGGEVFATPPGAFNDSYIGPHVELNNTAGGFGPDFVYIVSQADGKMLVGASDSMDLFRLNHDGTVDSGFTPVSLHGSNGANVDPVFLDGSGGILALQSLDAGSTSTTFDVTRYNPDGTPDLSFGPDATGTVHVNFGSGVGATNAGVNSLAVQSDGKIVAMGWDSIDGNLTGRVAMARLIGDILSSSGMQDALNSQPPVNPATGNPTVTVQATTQTEANDFLALFQNPSTPGFTPLTPPAGATTPTDISLTLGSGISFNEASLVIPQGIRVQINGGTWYGGSPALTLSSGNLTITGATFQNATDAPTILVTGGSLTLRSDVVQESTGFTDAAIAVTGGTVDLGTASSPGNNTINVNGTGQFVQNTTANTISAVGDTFESGGTVLVAPTLSFTTATASAASAIPGQPVTLTATVAPNGSGTPTGSVDFYDTTTGIDLGTATLSNGVASLSPPFLSLGTHVLRTSYSGDGTFLPSLASVSESIVQSMYILNATANGALSLAGSASINIPGNLIVDSNSSTALTESGTASITAASIQVVGGVSLKGSATVSPAATTGVASVANPLASLSGPSTTGLTNYGAVSYSKGSYTLNPGIYTSIKASGTASLTLNPGVYLIEGGGFTVTGSASISGSGVTLYNTSSTYPSSTGSYGGITLSGTGTFSLTAPSSGSYAGVVIFQPKANTRAISLSGGAAAGLTGTVYAPGALLSLSGNASLNGALVVNELSLTGNASSTQSSDASDVSAGSTAGQLLAGDLLVYVNDPNSLFTSDELARIQDAVNAVAAIVAPYGISVSETTDSTAANVTIDTGSTSAAGGYTNGILGCWNPTGSEITMIQGWSWYAGSNATQIGASQYDFETTLTHELGHALGLGESSVTTSAMYGTLAAGTTIRTLTTADLSIPQAESGADAQRAAGFRPATDEEAAGRGIAAAPSASGETGRDLLFATLAINHLASAGDSVTAGTPVSTVPSTALPEWNPDPAHTMAQGQERAGQPLFAARGSEDDEQGTFAFAPVPGAGRVAGTRGAADPSAVGDQEPISVPRLLDQEMDSRTPPADPVPTGDRPAIPANKGGTPTEAAPGALGERVRDLRFAGIGRQADSSPTLGEILVPATVLVGMAFLLQDARETRRSPRLR